MSEQMTAARLAEIRERAERATAGSWRERECVYGRDVSTVIFDGGWSAITLEPADARFVAHAREDVPALLDEVERLRNENAGYKDDIEAGRLIRIPCREFFDSAGGTVWLVWGGEAIEMVHCGADIDADGKPFATLVCEDKIFPYRTPVAERDFDPTDWCTNTKYVSADEYEQTVFTTEKAALAALGKEREDG